MTMDELVGGQGAPRGRIQFASWQICGCSGSRKQKTARVSVTQPMFNLGARA